MSSYRSSRRRSRSRSPLRDRERERDRRRYSYRDRSRSRSPASRGSRGSNESHHSNSNNRKDRDRDKDRNRDRDRDRDYDRNKDKYRDSSKEREREKDRNRYDKYSINKYDRYDKYEKYDKYSSSKSNDNDHNDHDRSSSITRRKSRFSSGSSRHLRPEFNHPTNVAICSGNIPSSIRQIDIQSAIRTLYKPISIIIIRNGNILNDSIKYVLIRFKNISDCIHFVENNDEYYRGEYLLKSNIILKLNYYKIKEIDNDNDNKLCRALKCDWLCNKCYYFNEYPLKNIKNHKNHKNNRKKDNILLYKCGRNECESLIDLDCIRVDKKSGSPYINGEIIIDQSKGKYINLKSNCVLIIEGIHKNINQNVIIDAFKPYGSIKYVYILNKANNNDNNNVDSSGVLRGCIAFIQFNTSNDAKNALKQAILNNITISSLPINLAFIQYKNDNNNNNISDVNNTTRMNNAVHDTFIHNLQQQAQWTNNKNNNNSKDDDNNNNNKDGDKSSNNVNLNPSTSIITAAAAAAVIQNSLLVQPKASDWGIADTFTWDAASNCFYDPNSGYYYDIRRRLYYFNGEFYNWDPKQMKYVQVEDPHAIKNDDDDEDDDDINMKNQNNPHDCINLSPEKEKEKEQSGPIKFGFKLNKVTINNDDDDKNGNGANNKIEYGNDNGDILTFPKKQQNIINKLPLKLQIKFKKLFIDRNKFYCHLCKRKFDNISNLSQHIKLSQYHIHNLSKWTLNQQIKIDKLNKAASAFFSSVSASSSSTSTIKLKQKKQSSSLQDKFLQMMNDYDNSRCDKSSDGSIRALMK